MRADLRDFRGVAMQVGAVMIGLGLASALCGVVGYVWDIFEALEGKPRDSGIPLYLGAGISLLIGAPLYRYGKRRRTPAIGRRDAVLAVTLIWIAAGVCGGIPFVIGADLDPASAFFEAISGFTTTGATVIPDIEVRLSRTMLLWRSLIQWLGGMGIVVLFVAVFPNLGAGSKRLFKGEVPGTTAEGLKPRIRETSYELWRIYAALTLLEAILLTVAGMSPFEAICHALTNLATGGFSTRDDSISAFNSPAIEYIVCAFMFCGAVNFALYYAMLSQRSLRAFVRNLEFRALVGIVIVSTIVLTIMNYGYHGAVEVSFRKSLFMVLTAVSESGYATDDYMAWSPAALGIFVLLMLVGGSSGSTAGGIKIERALLLVKQALVQIKKSYRPSVVQLVRMGRQVIPAEILADVSVFFLLYMSSIVFGVLCATLIDGVPVPTAFGASITCLGNTGPHPFWVGADNFVSYSAPSKLMFTWLMLLGRLEFYTLLALFVPGFWRR